jgi:glycosyltransferase involved in cell wall biosynthesis
MKVLMIIDGLRVGGAERRMLSLVQMLNQTADSQAEIIVLSSTIHFKKEIRKNNIKVHIIERKPKKDPRVFFKVLKICRSYKPDIIHAWGSMSAIYSIPARVFYKIRFINGMIVNAPVKPPSKDYYRARISFPFSDFIVSNTEAGIRAYDAPPGRTRCIPNGFSFERLNNLQEAQQVRQKLDIHTPYIVGMVGRLDNDKDFNAFIMAAIEVVKKRSDVTFVAIGGGNLHDQLNEAIPAEYKEFIRLTGQREDVESIINILDIGVLLSNTYLREGLSNVIIEYMACGKPTIATWGGGNNEIIADSLSGFLIPDNNIALTAEKIQFLLDNPDARKRMGDFGNELIRSKYTIERMVKDYLELYQQALQPDKLGITSFSE